MNSPSNGSTPHHLQEGAWDRIAASARFQHLLACKKKFIVPAFFFFLAYYLLLPILLGYAPRFMSRRILGTVTFAYLFALSQFVVGWAIAWMYLKASRRFDKVADQILQQESSGQETPSQGER